MCYVKKIHCAFIVKNRSLAIQTGSPQQEGLSGAFSCCEHTEPTNNIHSEAPEQTFNDTSRHV